MPERKLKVLAVCPFPSNFPSTRFRLLQYVEALRGHGIDIEVRPFLNAAEHGIFFDDPRILSRLPLIAAPIMRRLADVFRAARADVVLVQRESMPFGPAIFEFLFRTFGRKRLVLDIDDAVYIPYTRGRYGRLGSFLKFYGKSERLMRTAHTVVCGGQFLADYVKKKGGQPVYIPTIVDKELFKPSEKSSAVPVIGWIGTPSSYRYLRAIFPALERVGKKHRFTLLLRGTGEETIRLSNVIVDNKPWNADTEVEDFRSMDIGLYPLVENEDQSLEFIQGKSGFKAIQYLALGIPYIVSPIGVTSSIGITGQTHFEARNIEEWEEKLDKLLSDRGLRVLMGRHGREHFLQNYDLEHWSARLAEVLKKAAE